MSKSYTTTKRKLGITEQAVGAVLSSCSCDVCSRLPRSRTDLRDAKSKEVKSEFHFTLNVQGSSPDEVAIVFSANKEIPLQKEEHGFLRVLPNCRWVAVIHTTTLYLVVATDGKKTSFRAREER